MRAALREFDAAFAAYQGGLSRLNSYANSSYAKYEDAEETWRPFFHQQRGYLRYLLGDIAAAINHYLQAYRTAPTPAEQIEHLLNVGILQQRTQDYRLARFYFRFSPTPFPPTTAPTCNRLRTW